MRRIYKYHIYNTEEIIELSNPKFLSIQMQGVGDIPVLWAEVDMEPPGYYAIRGLCTGEEPLDGYTYISTVQIEGHVQHFYWRKLRLTDLPQKEEW